LIPGQNDDDAELDALTRWVAEALGPDVPLHFTAFHPDFKMLDTAATPPATLTRARRIGLANGLRYVYTGNVHDPAGGTTACQACGTALVVRDWYRILEYHLTADAHCPACGAACAGVFDARPGAWGPRRQPVRLAR
jgi:pyruvate formate lyase activating enzyme